MNNEHPFLDSDSNKQWDYVDDYMQREYVNGR